MVKPVRFVTGMSEPGDGFVVMLQQAQDGRAGADHPERRADPLSQLTGHDQGLQHPGRALFATVMADSKKLTVFFRRLVVPLCTREISFYRRRRGANEIRWVDVFGKVNGRSKSRWRRF